MESLSNKYRPKTFDEVVGQDITIKILKRQIELDKPSNTYIFEGITGSGKTTLARLINKHLNNNDNPPIEIDAASNNGVDNVRNIIKEAQERSLSGRYKVYIIDEAHGLSNQAWQAFLKCIEETPKYTIFIFCTTDAQKIPETIKNRCQVFHLNRIPTNDIYNRLEYICNQEGILNYSSTIDYISRVADGSMRTAISMLDKCCSYNKDLNINDSIEILGSYSYNDLFDLVNYLIDGKQKEALSLINNLYNKGKDLKLFIDQYLTFCLDLNKYAIFKDCRVTKIPQHMVKDLDNATNIENAAQYYSLVVNKLLQLKLIAKDEPNIKQLIEIYLIQISKGQF